MSKIRSDAVPIPTGIPEAIFEIKLYPKQRVKTFVSMEMTFCRKPVVQALVLRPDTEAASDPMRQIVPSRFIKEVKTMEKNQKLTFRMMIPVLIACLLVAACSLTNPPADEPDSSFCPIHSPVFFKPESLKFSENVSG